MDKMDSFGTWEGESFRPVFKLFTSRPDQVSLDDQLNYFSQNNPDIKILKIHYQFSNGLSAVHTALVLYKGHATRFLDPNTRG